MALPPKRCRTTPKGKWQRKTFYHSFKNLHGTNPQIPLQLAKEDTKAGYVLHCKVPENCITREDTFQKSRLSLSLLIALGDSKHRDLLGRDIASYS